MSKISILRLDSVRDIQLWNELLFQFPIDCQDVYFTPEYHNLHVANQEGQGVCFYMTDGQHALMVMGMLMPISDIFFDLQTCNGYGGPITTKSVPQSFLFEAWAVWKDACKSSGIIAAFFRLHPLLELGKNLPSDALVRYDRQTVSVDLTIGIPQIWSNADSRFRNRVTKAKKNGVSVEWNTKACWEFFPDLYLEAMKRLSASQNLCYNREYFKLLQETKFASVAGIFQAGNLVSGAVFLLGNKFAHYHLGARKEDSDSFLMNALFQAGLEKAAEAGKSALHFGGGRTSVQDDSLLRFKKRLGGELLFFSISVVICSLDKFKLLCDKRNVDAANKSEWLLPYRQP